jgi:hypothetical protein
MLSSLKDYESKLHCLEIEKFLTNASKFNKKNDFIKLLES